MNAQTTQSTQTHHKIAILHAFFRPKGGGENFTFDLRNHLKADLFAGGLDEQIWSKDKIGRDSFVTNLYDKNYNLTYLHKESSVPFWRKVKRQLFFKFSPKINELNNYDVVFFSGNIAGVAGRLDPKVKKIMYCHTPPRPFTDRLEVRLKESPKWKRPFMNSFAKWVRAEYRKELGHMDVILTNSVNIQHRLKDFIGLDSQVVFPPVKTNRYQNISTGDYFLSYGRLEDLKRMKLIVETFAANPDKKLVICSTGPLKNWIEEQIESRNLTNITFEGLVSDERLAELVGKCLAGIYIPVQEDFGIIQCELMAAGKPVIGVQEGGLLETVLDGETGILIPTNPTQAELSAAIINMTPSVAKTMKSKCIEQAKKFDEQVFYDAIDKIIKKL
jgi:glycosyltransferase involved in cell wall biosynthesis